mmetsp:Transcript_34290/g.80153  ORF Transcript_34290/g.80153 Transcript_34290/m.80153 type:complete len:244 (-) Transcript_34290:56-787(-)
MFRGKPRFQFLTCLLFGLGLHPAKPVAYAMNVRVNLNSLHLPPAYHQNEVGTLRANSGQGYQFLVSLRYISSMLLNQNFCRGNDMLDLVLVHSNLAATRAQVLFRGSEHLLRGAAAVNQILHCLMDDAVSALRCQDRVYEGVITGFWCVLLGHVYHATIQVTLSNNTFPLLQDESVCLLPAFACCCALRLSEGSRCACSCHLRLVFRSCFFICDLQRSRGLPLHTRHFCPKKGRHKLHSLHSY